MYYIYEWNGIYSDNIDSISEKIEESIDDNVSDPTLTNRYHDECDKILCYTAFLDIPDSERDKDIARIINTIDFIYQELRWGVQKRSPKKRLNNAIANLQIAINRIGEKGFYGK